MSFLIHYKYTLFLYIPKYKTKFFSFFIQYPSKCLSIKQINFLPCFNRMNAYAVTNKISIKQVIQQIYFFWCSCGFVLLRMVADGFRFAWISYVYEIRAVFLFGEKKAPTLVYRIGAVFLLVCDFRAVFFNLGL